LADEVDRYPPSAGTEGDPISLARRRLKNFWNAKFIATSTPTVKGFSRIEAEFELSDKRKFFVPCPHCAHRQALRWEQVKWPAGRPAEALYHCEECGVEWSENERHAAVRRGTWQATAPGNGNTAGFHLNELYSPWTSLADIAQEFLDAKGNPETLKTWINTSLGETWEEDAERADAHSLMSRLEDWGDTAPKDVLVVTCGVDMQDDRIEIERVGWGIAEESWSLEHRIIYGDPSGPDIWGELDDYLLTPTRRVDGTQLPVAATAIDSGGHHTLAVYKFVATRFRRRVYAIKGVGGPGKIVWPKRSSRNNKGKINLFSIGVDPAKDAIYARLKVKKPGPGYCHFPADREAQWFEQLTAEIVQTKYVKGFPTRVYVLPSGVRNEALDCRVYAYAVLQGMNVRWGRMLELDANRRSPKSARPPKPPSVSGELYSDDPDDRPSRAVVQPKQHQTKSRGRRVVRRGAWMT
jgi:phage terminase large subunit GpA-like protein